MTPNEEQRAQEKEYECVSRQSDCILSHMENRFNYLMANGRNEDAIAVGDEYFEWLSQDPDEVFLYYNEKELQEQYDTSS